MILIGVCVCVCVGMCMKGVGLMELKPGYVGASNGDEQGLQCT